jgi:hypothetical protein
MKAAADRGNREARLRLYRGNRRVPVVPASKEPNLATNPALLDLAANPNVRRHSVRAGG